MNWFERIIIFSLVIVLGGITAWMQMSFLDESADEERVLTESHDPDYYIEDFTAVGMDINGARQYVLEAERNGTKPPGWIKVLIYISIPMAFSIHTMTAFIYCGLPGRGFWLTAILAPRFLASAFASGPALLILLALILKKCTKFDPGKEAIAKLATIVTYAMVINLFLLKLMDRR